MLNLSSAYAPFVNGGKKNLSQDDLENSRQKGKTIFQQKNRKCVGCDKFIDNEFDLPNIESTNEKVLAKKQLIR